MKKIIFLAMFITSTLSFTSPTWIEYLIKVDSPQNAAKIVAATDKFMSSEFVKNNFDMEGGMDVEDTFNLVASCIDQIYSEEESWPASESTKKELVDFIEQLGTQQFKEIEKFFETMPKLSHTIKVKNPKTEVENEIVLEGLAAFFG